jgi:hypothetical protein
MDTILKGLYVSIHLPMGRDASSVIPSQDGIQFHSMSPHKYQRQSGGVQFVSFCDFQVITVNPELFPDHDHPPGK